MYFIRERVLAGEFMTGAWCNLASSITVEMAAMAGFDWVLIDQEHGPGDNSTLLRQLQGIGQRPTAAITRLPWNEMPQIKRALDLGNSGIMIPYIETAEEAANAVSYMTYPPKGQRGAAVNTRAARYGTNFENYFKEASDKLLTVTQIETGLAVKNAEDIAAVEGVDVLFVGPMDLSISVNLPKRFDDQEYCDILGRVAAAAKKYGKAAGILLPNTQLLDLAYDLGYTFVAVGADSGMVMQGMKANRAAMEKFKK